MDLTPPTPHGTTAIPLVKCLKALGYPMEIVSRATDAGTVSQQLVPELAYDLEDMTKSASVGGGDMLRRLKASIVDVAIQFYDQQQVFDVSLPEVFDGLMKSLKSAADSISPTPASVQRGPLGELSPRTPATGPKNFWSGGMSPAVTSARLKSPGHIRCPQSPFATPVGSRMLLGSGIRVPFGSLYESPKPSTPLPDLPLSIPAIKRASEAPKQVGAIALMGLKGQIKGKYRSRKQMTQKANITREKKLTNVKTSLKKKAETGENLTKRERLVSMRDKREAGKYLIEEHADAPAMSAVPTDELPLECRVFGHLECGDSENVSSSLHKSLELSFNYTQFREDQLSAITTILGGESESVVLTLPTGHGKSLVMQLASIHIAKEKNEIIVAVYPTISLIDDQFKKMTTSLRAAKLDHTVSKAQVALVYEGVSNGEVDILLTTPEAIGGQSLKGAIRRCPRPLGLVCFDEVHCISEWGSTFRPAYLTALHHLRQLGAKRVLGVTATATCATVEGISKALGGATVIRGTQDVCRHNLICGVTEDSHTEDWGVAQEVRQLLSKDYRRMKSVIVYTWRQQTADTIYRELKTTLGASTSVYHSRLPADERQSTLNAFMNGKIRVIVATMALGLGLDKQDVDVVIHANLPATVEQYIQETGRCNRNGKSAGRCQLLLRDIDFKQRKQQIASSCCDDVGLKRFVANLRYLKRAPPTTWTQHKNGMMVLSMTKEELACAVGVRQMDDADVLLELFNYNSLNAYGQVPFVKGELASWITGSEEGMEAACKISALPFKMLKVRFYKSDYNQLCEENPKLALLKPYIKKCGGTTSIDTCGIYANEGVEPGAVEEVLAQLGKNMRFSIMRDGYGSVIGRIHDACPLDNEDVVHAVVASLKATNDLQLSRLKTVYSIMQEAAQDKTQLKPLVQSYFDEDDVPMEDDEDFPEIPNESQLLINNTLDRINRHPITRDSVHTHTEVFSKSGAWASTITPVVLARFLCGMTTHEYSYKNARGMSGWDSLKGTDFAHVYMWCEYEMSRLT